MIISDNARGAMLMMGSMAAFTLNDACMKSLAGTVPLMQVIFLRGVITVTLMIALARILGSFRMDLPRRDWALIGLRTFAEVGAAYFFLTALFHMPIANVTAVLQAMPLSVTLAGAVFLREPVGVRRLLAILIGFIGVMLIIRPGPGGFNTYSIYVLVAVAFVTLRDLSARRLSRDVPSMTVALSAALGVTVFSGAASLAGEWVPVGPSALLVISGAALFVIAGYLLSVMVMRVGDIGFVAPFRYTSLIWALVLGLLVFGEWPDIVTLAGAALVIATGIFTFWREHVLRRRGEAVRASRPRVPGLRER